MKQDEYKRGLVRNLRNIAPFRVLLNSFGFPIATIVLFFEQHGLKMSEVLLLQAIFAVAASVLEVPSGYVADVLGRRRTLIAGSVVAAISALAYLCADGFAGFLGAELLIALAASLISGADQALVYDSMVELRLEHKFSKLWSRVNCWELFGGASIMLVGGLVGAYNYRLPFVLTLLGFVAMSWYGLKFIEPERKKLVVEHGHFKELGRIALECLYRRKELGWLILCAAVLHMFNQAGFWLYQPILKLRDIPEVYFGLVYAGMSFGAAYMASKVHLLEDRLGFVRCVALAALVGASGYWLVALIDAPWGLGFVLAFQFVRVVNRVLFSHQLNKLVDSEFRATAVSIKNLAMGASYSVLLVALGPVVDLRGPMVTYYVLGAGMLLCGLLVLAVRPNRKRALVGSLSS